MQIALEKEFQAKEQLIEEKNNLKHELELRQHQIADFQAQIDVLNKEILRYQSDVDELKQSLLNQQILSAPGNYFIIELAFV